MTGPQGVAGRRVLALGSGLTLLGVLRVLAEDGVEAMALPDAGRPASRSRAWRPGPAALAGLSPDRLADALSALAPGTVLIPCADSWARAVSRLPPDVRARYPASVAAPEALEVLLDKSRFATRLATLGLPHPVTWPVGSDGDFEAALRTGGHGWFLKPADSQRFFARFGVKAFHVTTPDEARARLEDCRRAGLEVILQQYIEGPPTNHYFVDGFVDREGITRARFVRRRLRMHPSDFGNSTLMVSVPPAEAAGALETLEILLGDLHYRGVFSAEFKRNARTGELEILEVNTRAWWFVEFAARCGIDVCALSILDARHEAVPTLLEYPIGRRCAYPYFDYFAIREEALAGRLSVPRGVGSWVGAYQTVFRWSDPWPAWSGMLGIVGRRLSRWAH